MAGEANAAIAHVRKEFGTDLNAEVAAWLMLAEGIANFASGDYLAALDRIRRAEGVAAAFDAPRARPSCAAWLAHIQFNLSQFDEMLPNLVRAIRDADSTDHQALARASLVVADSYHYCGHFSIARRWYEATRLHATAVGDEAMLGAMLHNVAAFRAANVLLAHSLGQCLPDEAHRAKLEARSAANYDYATGVRTFESLSTLLAAQLSLVDDQLQEAFDRLSAIQTTSIPARLAAVLHCDLALCAARMGQTERARELCESAVSEVSSEMDDDDSAYVWARLSDLHRRFGDIALSAQMAERANQAMSRLRNVRESLKLKLDSCLGPITS
jgi:tetratricopeptide (TPR) repeat protein